MNKRGVLFFVFVLICCFSLYRIPRVYGQEQKESGTSTGNLDLIKGLLRGRGLHQGRATVATATKEVQWGPAFIIKDREEFLNNLERSPYWKVETDHGVFVAKARVMLCEHKFVPSADGSYRDCDDRFPAFDYFNNHDMKDYTNFDLVNDGRISIWFGPINYPMPYSTCHMGEKTCKLDVTDDPTFYKLAGGSHANAFSSLVIPLNEELNIFLMIGEGGDDFSREKTFASIPIVMKEIASLADSKDYSARERYALFFSKMFGELKGDIRLVRKPGEQSRDIFYGYIKTDPKKNLEGINIRISNPDLCRDGECTRSPDRLRKAEYLGQPKRPDDYVFFQIEDNAVYVSSDEALKKYGTFSGDSTFKAKIEILNINGDVLYEDIQDFKSWER